MALYINTTKVGSTAYMGSTKLNKIKFNGTDVWTGEVPYYNDLKNGTVLSESQWLAFLSGGGVAEVIKNNDQSSFRGKIVTIENSKASSYNKWKIADFNHDNTSNTVDLINQNIVHNDAYAASDTYYQGSYVRNYLRNTYINGFSSSILNRMQTLRTYDASMNIDDKIKVLTLKELNTSYGGYTGNGTAYPIFTDDASRVTTGDNTYGMYWTTVKRASNTTCIISRTGAATELNSSSGTAAIRPCIRMI